ncbi:hypothetical protein Tco_1430526 [Tanacetum coccineum]
MGTIQYREDSNEAAFAVASVEKIYAHESLIFNDTVACEVISKWKAGLKDNMDARSKTGLPVGSQEYQMVCTRLDIASADVGMLDKCVSRITTRLQVFGIIDYAIGRSSQLRDYDNQDVQEDEKHDAIPDVL